MKTVCLKINAIWDYFYAIFTIEISQWPVDAEKDQTK